MKLPNQLKRILAFVLALVMVFGMMPVHAHAAGNEPIDAAAIFSDLHTSKSNYKESIVKEFFTMLKNTGLPISQVISSGDAFSVNEDSGKYTGDPTKITAAIHSGLGNTSIPVHYVWSDHDRYGTGIDKNSGFVYGAGNDGIYGNADDANYYVYSLSMADLSTNDRYKAGFHSDSAITATIAKFVADAAKLDQSKPLFIASHQPLFDRRDDNGHALEWCTAINQVAQNMDVAFFFGHNHRYDKAEDYFYAKGSTMPVTTTSLSSQNVVLNFTHMCAGYLEPTSTGSTSSTTRSGVLMVIEIHEDSIRYTTYNKSGKYTGNYAVDKYVPRDHAVTEPELLVSGSQSYFVGEDLNITVSLKTGSKVENVTAAASITGFDMNAAGDQIVTVSYAGLTAQYLIRVCQKTFLDAATGVSAEVSIPGATGLTVSTLGTDSTAYQATAGLMSNAVAYDVYLENGTEATITLPIPAGVSDPAVYYVSADGKTVTRMDLVQEGNTVSFVADKFASFVIGEDDHIPEAGDVVVGDAKYSYVKVTSAPVADGYYQLQNNHTSKYLTSTKTSGKNRLNLDNNGQNHIWYIKAVSGGYTIQYGGPDGQYLNFSHESATMSANPQTIQLLKSNSYWGIGATTGNPVAYLAREGTSSSSTSVHGYASSSYKYPGDEGMNWNLYQRVENQITYSVTAPNVSHFLGQNDDQVQLTYQLLANGAAGTAPAGGKWAFEIYKDKAGIIKSISDSGIITFNKVEGSAYVKIAFTWSEGTVYMYVKVTAEVDPNACDHVYTAETVAATCTQDGYTVYTCQCGDSYTEVIPATGHSYEAVVTAPTCMGGGYTTYTCACGDSYVADHVAALGHQYQAVTTAPTCEDAGYTTYTCHCGDSYVADEVAALGHDYKSVTTEATCTENGSIVYTCHCGHTYTEVIPALGHKYEAVVTAPTCTEDGFTTYTCACGDSYIADQVAALGHDYKSVTTEATCTEDGSIVYTCHCGDTYTEILPALGHSYEAVVTAPTCESIGFTTYTCHCGDSYIADQIAALGHKYEAVVTAPTCEDAGYTTYTCACGNSYVADQVAALGHDHKSVTTEATCTEDGSIIYTCHCGDTYTQILPALGHDAESVITAPTCETEGYTTHTCRRCGDVTVDTVVAALGHDYEKVTVAPTCTETGSVTETCLRCGESHTEVIPAAGHSHEAVVTAPTCTEAGYTTYTCHCGDSYVADVVAALGHNYNAVTTDATCTEDGSIVYTCHCGDTYTEVISALGHKYEAVVTAPTCENAGYTTYTCACGDSYVADEVAALGHSYEFVVTAPTCEDAGYTTYTCHCGDSNVADEVAALGHKYEAVVTAPTCEDAGYTTYTCHCGHSYVADEVAALGHSYEAVVTAPTCEDAGYTTYTCHCGHSYVADQVAALGHDYKSVTTAATCTENGSIVYTCHCGDTYTEEIPALGHKYETAVTAPTCEEAGFTTYTCHCGHSYVADEVAALGHAYESVTTAATCTENGFIVHTCHCGDTYTEVIPALGHSYEAKVTAPTCEDAGYTTYTCHCGDSYIADEAAALGHAYESVTTAATCTENGSIVYTCLCGDTYTEVIPALGHKYEAAVTAPTCENVGFTTYTCACGDSYIADEVAALGHKYDAVVTAPTCEKAGFTTYICHCGDSYVADQVAALGHDYKSVTTDATCTENGSVVYTCHCGDTYTEVIPAYGHSYEAKVTAPNCEEAGYTTYTCYCGHSYTADATAALGHSYETLEQNGVLIHTCGNCGHSYTESVAWIPVGSGYVLDTDGIEVGSEHKYIVVGATKDYALTVNGTSVSATAVTIRNNTLIVDDASKMELWFADNSSREKNTYLLTQDGSRSVYHVSGNINYGHDSKGYWYFGSSSNGLYQLYDKDGQSWYLNYGYVWSNQSANRFAVSSKAQSVRLFKQTDSYARLTGSLIQTVEDTANTSVAAILEKIAIQLSANGTDVTGTAAVTADMLTWNVPFDGTMAGTYTAEVIYEGVKLGTVTVQVTTKHSYVTTVVAPTCESQGYTERKCSECGISQKFDYTAALGHSYTHADADGYRTYTCVRCGDSYSEKLSFTYSQVSAFTSGERFVITVKSGNKYYALSHSGNNISAVQVTVSSGKITSQITEDLLWSYEDGKLSYVSGDETYYLYTYTSGWWGTTTNLGISADDPGAISLSSSKLKIDSKYLRYSSSKFSVSSSGTTVYLFQEK